MHREEKERKRTENNEWKGEKRARMFSSRSTARGIRDIYSLKEILLRKSSYSAVNITTVRKI